MGPSERVTLARRALLDLKLPPGTKVLAACSGGPDSLALAATLAAVGPEQGWVTGAVVIDHGLQLGSSATAAAAAALCRGLGLATEVVRVDVGSAGGPEGAARQARYDALDAAGAGGIVLLGHTLDDQAETVLLGLARGSGARSLSGMARAVGNYRRPFLRLRRADTVGICADLGLEPIQDPSNELDGPWRRADGGPLRRSAVRHTVMPALDEALGEGVATALARTADLLRADSDLLDQLAQAELEAARVQTEGPDVVLDVPALLALPEALRTRVVHRAIMEQTAPGSRGSVGSRHTRMVDTLLTDYRGQGTANLPGFVTATRTGKRLVIARQAQQQN